MGSKQCKPVVDAPVVKQILKPWDVADIQQEFLGMAAAPDIITGKIDRGVFMKFLARIFDPFSETVLARMFIVMDLNGDGFIDYNEFLCCMYITSYSQQEQRFKFVFDLFDFDATGRISKKNFKRFSMALLQNPKNGGPEEGKVKAYLPLGEVYVQFVFQNYDRTNEGSLNWTSWRRFADEDDQVDQVIKCMTSQAKQRQAKYIPRV